MIQTSLNKTQMRTARSVLSKVLTFFNNTPEKWTKGSFAKTEYGTSTFETSDNATCFCLVGAIRRFSCDNEKAQFWDEKKELVARKALSDFAPALRDRRSIVNYNDAPSTTFADVKKQLRLAIAAINRRIK